VTTARQAAANRRNAHASTGPRSQAGRRRAAGNARRHGVTAPLHDAEVRAALDALVERLGTASTDVSAEARAALLDWARAEAACARVRAAEHLVLARHEARLAAPGDGSARRAAEAADLLAAFQSDGVDPDLLRGLEPPEAREARELSLFLRYRSAAEITRRRARHRFAALQAASETDAAMGARPMEKSETNPNSSSG